MTGLTAAEERTAAWKTLPCRYAPCSQPTGRRCITSSGARTTPHAPRLYDIRAYLLGQATARAEVDGLTAQVASLKASNDQLDAALSASDDKVTMASQRLANLQLDLTHAQADLTKALSDKAALDVLFSNLSTSDTALRAQVAALQAQIAELTDPPAPEPARPLFGMNLSPGTSFTGAAKESAADIVKRLVATYGDLDCGKVFYSGALPAAFNVTQEGLIPGRVAIVCFKSFTAAALKSYLASIPAGWLVILVYFQEPDDEIFVDKTMTLADFQAKTRQVLDTVHAHPAYTDGRALVGSCFMEFSLTSGRWVDALVVKGLDVLIWDAYWNTSAGDPTARVKAMAAVAKRFGVPKWAIGEKGDRRANTTLGASMQKATFATGVDRAAFWGKEYAAEVDAGVFASCYFNAIGTTGDHRLIPGEAYSDQVIALLKPLMNPPAPASPR